MYFGGIMFNIEQFPSVLLHFKSISKIFRKNSSGWYEIFCPYCDDAVRKANPNHGHGHVAPDFPFVHCFRCGFHGNLNKVLIDTGFKDNDVLKEIAKPIVKIDKNIKTLLDNMATTMYEENGVGLAAPQVGVSVRVVVIDAGNGLIEIINPEITNMEGTACDTEGCLSIPGIFGEVERAAKVTVEFLDRKGKKKKINAEGLLARAFQHEIDHLDGILFIDRAKTISKGK